MRQSNRLETVWGYLEYVLKPGQVVEILTIEIYPQYRRAGHASRPIVKLRAKFPRHTIHVFTRRTNGVARLFYQSLGFFELIVPAYYYQDSDSENDACLFVDHIRP